MTHQEIKKEIAATDAFITVLKISLNDVRMSAVQILETNKAIESNKEYITTLLQGW